MSNKNSCVLTLSMIAAVSTYEVLAESYITTEHMTVLF